MVTFSPSCSLQVLAQFGLHAPPEGQAAADTGFRNRVPKSVWNRPWCVDTTQVYQLYSAFDRDSLRPDYTLIMYGYVGYVASFPTSQNCRE